MTPLERRYRRLLRLYPARYRARRGQEILGTLLEASAPGQSWPSARDTSALVAGGLRARSVESAPPTMAAGLRQMVMLGAVLFLTSFAGEAFDQVIQHPALSHSSNDWLMVTAFVSLAAVASIWLRSRALKVILALAVVGLWLHSAPGASPEFIQAGIALVLAILVATGQRMPDSWLWLAAMFLAALLFFAEGDNAVPLAVVGGVAVVWSVADARVMTAVALWFVIDFSLDVLALGVGSRWLWPVQPLLAGSVVLAVGGIWRLRRGVVLAGRARTVAR